MGLPFLLQANVFFPNRKVIRGQKLQDHPVRLQERIFEKLFRIAEIATFTPFEREAYEESLKVYRDLKNSIETAREEGRIEGIGERNIEVAETMLKNGENDRKVSMYTGLLSGIIQDLRKKLNLPQRHKFLKKRLKVTI